jgi:hypothetical protein
MTRAQSGSSGLRSRPVGLCGLQAEYRDWARPAPTVSLRVEPGAGEDGPVGAARLCWQGAGPFPRTVQTGRGIWLAAPNRVRVEIRRGKHIVRLGVCDGTSWWRWDQVAGVESSDGAPTAHDRALPPLLDPPLLTPVRLLSGLRLGHVGAGERTGREVVTAGGQPRQRSLGGSPQLRFELEFDAEHGTMLRIAAYDNRKCIQLTEATEVAYVRERDPGLFTWPPAGIAGIPTAQLRGQAASIRTD